MAQGMLTQNSFILNNNGYTVERLIHGKHETYNEVAHWDYSNLAKTFGPSFKSRYHGPIKTNEEFARFIQSEAAREDCFQVCSRHGMSNYVGANWCLKGH